MNWYVVTRSERVIGIPGRLMALPYPTRAQARAAARELGREARVRTRAWWARILDDRAEQAELDGE